MNKRTNLVRGFALFALVLLAASSRAAPEPRPKIGLVLGGGGALGLSHVGVLKVLEEMRVPIDYIAGTSMGSIIAGLYASGMAPQEIEDFLASLDWVEVMRDQTPRKELFFRRKFDDQRYLFELGLDRRGVKIGTGMAAGQKFNNLMQYATLRAAGITNFNELPIPFRAVATDLESGRPYVIGHGNLGLAMRASMAVPGVFTPVEIDGRILIDGGVVENLPVAVVKAMGADVIIAVDVGSASDNVDKEKFKTLGGILGRTYAIAQRPGQVEQFKLADIGIQPDSTGLTASQFDRVAEFIPLGEKAAREKESALADVQVDEDTFSVFLDRQRRAHPEHIQVSRVVFTGNQRVDADVIRGRVRHSGGQPFSLATANLDLMRMYGIGEFESALFTLTPDSETTRELHYHLKEKSWGPLYLKYGLQLRSDFDRDSEWSMLMNLTRMSVNRLGAEWRNEIQLGSVIDVMSEFYQPLDARGLFFVAPHVEYRSEFQNVYDGKDRVAEYDVDSVSAAFDFGMQLRSYAELRAGPVWGKGKARIDTGTADLEEFDEDYAGWAVSLVVDRQDRTLFAREGYFLKTTGLFARESMGGERDYEKATVEARWRTSWDDHTIVLGMHGGSSLGSDLPGYTQLLLGGPFSFSGLAEGQFRGSYLGVGQIGYHYRLTELPSQLGRAVYLMTRLDIGNVWEDDIDTDDLRYGGSIGLGADTSAGPVYISYGRTDDGYSSIYFSLGTVF